MLVAVRGGRRVPQEGESAGVLAGLRYLARDRLLGPMTLTVVVLDGAAGAIAVAVPLLAYTRYGQNAHVAGWLFTSFGVGAIIGSVLAMKVLDRVPPLRLACVALVLGHAAAVGDRGSDLLARRVRGCRLLRRVRGDGERADDGADHDAPAARPAREGADRR